MAYIFRLPEMGEGLTEGDVASWLIKEGEAIKEGFKGKRETDQQIQEKEIYRRRLLV